MSGELDNSPRHECNANPLSTYDCGQYADHDKEGNLCILKKIGVSGMESDTASGGKEDVPASNRAALTLELDDEYRGRHFLDHTPSPDEPDDRSDVTNPNFLDEERVAPRRPPPPPRLRYLAAAGSERDKRASQLYRGTWPHDAASQPTQHSETKTDCIYSLLSLVSGSGDRSADLSEPLLEMSLSPDSCRAMRQSGCVPLLVQLMHSGRTLEARERAASALRNVIEAQSDDKAGRREARVWRLLEQVREYTLQLEQGGDIGQHPSQSVAALMKLSFDEEHRHAVCTLGGLQALAALVSADHKAHGRREEGACLTMRKYAGMTLTNLTFGDGNNKSLLCSHTEFMAALVEQLQSPNDDMRQVTSAVLRNLSWRADAASKQVLRDTGAVEGLTRAAMSCRKEATLKSVLSALWNLTAHCSANKAALCAVLGALAFLVDALARASPPHALAVVENAGGIVRNVSSHIAVRDDYRAVLRERDCLAVLLQHLKSPSLTVVSNACGTLWNLSARCPRDQAFLWDRGAVPMLRSLVHSKHKMIAMGSSAALKNLLNSRPGKGRVPELDATARAMNLPALPTLGARKRRGIEQELDELALPDTCDNIEPSVSRPTRRLPVPTPRGAPPAPPPRADPPPRDYSVEYRDGETSPDKQKEGSSFGDYQETDLDQPTDYSLRYAERHSETGSDASEPPHEDTIQHFCTEGTPYETPGVFSTATSCSDLRVIGRKPVAVVKPHPEAMTQSDEKDTCSIEEPPRHDNDAPTEPAPASHFQPALSSGRASPERPVRYCEEGTPGCFSRHSSLSSIDAECTDEGVARRNALASRVPATPPPPAPHKDRDGSKAVTFACTPEPASADEPESATACVEDTPLVFSRCSSPSSLSGCSGAPDHASVVSEMSRLTSGCISPSDIPDSPGASVPQSPRPARAPRTPPVPRPAANRSVFEDRPNTFTQVENTPAHFSTATSLSSLTIDDEHEPREADKIPDKLPEPPTPAAVVGLGDTCRAYCTEDTPALLSKVGSVSDLSALSFETGAAPPPRRDSSTSSNLSDAGTDILQECILRGIEQTVRSGSRATDVQVSDAPRIVTPPRSPCTPPLVTTSEPAVSSEESPPPPLPPKLAPPAPPPRPPPLPPADDTDALSDDDIVFQQAVQRGMHLKQRRAERLESLNNSERAERPEPVERVRADSLSSLSVDSYGSTDREIFEEVVKLGLAGSRAKAHSAERILDLPQEPPHQYGRGHQSLDRAAAARRRPPAHHPRVERVRRRSASDSGSSLSGDSFGSTDKEVFERSVRLGMCSPAREARGRRRREPPPGALDRMTGDEDSRDRALLEEMIAKGAGETRPKNVPAPSAARAPADGSGDPARTTSTSRSGSDPSHSGSCRPNSGSDRPNDGVDRPNDGSDRLSSGSARSNSGSDRPISGSDHTNESDRSNESHHPNNGSDLCETPRCLSDSPMISTYRVSIVCENSVNGSQLHNTPRESDQQCLEIDGTEKLETLATPAKTRSNLQTSTPKNGLEPQWSESRAEKNGEEMSPKTPTRSGKDWHQKSNTSTPKGSYHEKRGTYPQYKLSPDTLDMSNECPAESMNLTLNSEALDTSNEAFADLLDVSTRSKEDGGALPDLLERSYTLTGAGIRSFPGPDLTERLSEAEAIEREAARLAAILRSGLEDGAPGDERRGSDAARPRWPSVLARRALSRSMTPHLFGSSERLDSAPISLLDNVKPPAEFEQLDMESSLGSVASLASDLHRSLHLTEDTNQRSRVKEDPLQRSFLKEELLQWSLHLSGDSNQRSQLREELLERSLHLNEESEDPNRRSALLTEDLLQRSRNIADDFQPSSVSLLLSDGLDFVQPPSLMELLDEEVTETVQPECTTPPVGSPLPSDLSSTSGTPKRRMTPKEKRRVSKERYQTYTIDDVTATDVTLHDDFGSDLTLESDSRSEDLTARPENKIKRRLSAKQRRQEDRARYQTQTVVITQSVVQTTVVPDTDQDSLKKRLLAKKTIKEKRVENAERFRTRTIEDAPSPTFVSDGTIDTVETTTGYDSLSSNEPGHQQISETQQQFDSGTNDAYDDDLCERNNTKNVAPTRKPKIVKPSVSRDDSLDSNWSCEDAPKPIRGRKKPTYVSPYRRTLSSKPAAQPEKAAVKTTPATRKLNLPKTAPVAPKLPIERQGTFTKEESTVLPKRSLSKPTTSKIARPATAKPAIPPGRKVPPAKRTGVERASYPSMKNSPSNQSLQSNESTATVKPRRRTEPTKLVRSSTFEGQPKEAMEASKAKSSIAIRASQVPAPRFGARSAAPRKPIAKRVIPA